MKKIIGEYIRRSIDELGNLEIVLSIKNYNDKKAIQELEKGTYSIQISKVKSQRSLNQNKYFWKLCSMIADEMNEDVMDVYIQLLEDSNAKCEYVMGLESIEDELKKNFRAVKVVRPEYYHGKKMIVYKCFIGSSKFDVKEMNLLIEKAQMYCAELDIDTGDEYVFDNAR